ncbi:hypothetical protein SESBI_20255 [Sesbania bispinosa]|nr:hypothetical protein SESBI_20255 [Sesbania bispinosa]
MPPYSSLVIVHPPYLPQSLPELQYRSATISADDFVLCPCISSHEAAISSMKRNQEPPSRHRISPQPFPLPWLPPSSSSVVPCPFAMVAVIPSLRLKTLRSL